MVLPTCECGVISIVRQLLKKGASPQFAITYMLSSPVINPLVLASTYIAFRGDARMVLGRVSIVAACAACLGLLLSEMSPAELLRGEAEDPPEDEHAHHGCCAPGGSRGRAGAGACACQAGDARPGWPGAAIEVLSHTASEFMDMGKYLILGALAVGLSKVFLPEDLLLLFQKSVPLAVGAMMLLAVLVSVCSQADAFVAASFLSFPAAAKLSFLTLGPMVDLKLILMYSRVFSRRAALTLILGPMILIYAISIMLGMVFGVR
jgi:hypothetical protein